ncbi:Armadillo repeat-containing protein 5 [Araneus ventricosus]|uniref:Armadillo repeat-containing protein 5 n=1 Tax=Araneus ventricosus TaxID=182803 RepID=A0A4Y2AGB3_ARAVE|nr:Armadillo repeat-containing protein 5 [Araneus ventricosus]
MFIKLKGPNIRKWKPERYLRTWLRKHRSADDTRTRRAKPAENIDDVKIKVEGYSLPPYASFILLIEGFFENELICRMAGKEEVELLKRLKSGNKSDVYNALVKIRKHYVRNYKKMKKLPQTFVIKLLISFIEDPRYCNLALSIIADACLEKNLVFEIIRQDGIQSLMRIMKSLVNDNIQNRACRALGNIAKCEVGLKQVVTLNPIPNILQFLTGTTDKNCQQTAVRTLRILARDSKSREIIVRENGIIYVAKLLGSSSKEVLQCTTKALAELSENCTIVFARQMLEMHSIKMLVELYSHSERDIRTHALTSLKNLSSQEEIRSDLIKVGAVKLFAEIAMSNKSFEMSKLATLALCSCLDHIHMWNNYGVSRHTGLKAILEVLRQRTFEDIHIHIITSLLPLCYECGGSETLFELEIIQILIQNLEHFINRHKTDHIVPVSDSESLIKNEAPPSLPPVELKSNSDDELSCNSYDTLSSKDYDIPLTETTFKRAKINREISCLDFDDFSPVNFSTASAPVKNVSKFYNSSYWNLHSSGASSYCSPSSSGSNTATSPNFYDFSVGSPVADPWSPQSDANETGLCWSPVLNCSDSSCDYPETEVEVSCNSKKQTCLEIIKTQSSKSKMQFGPIFPSKKKLHSPNQSPISASSSSNKTDTSEIPVNITDAEKSKCDLETKSCDDKEYPAFKKHKVKADVAVTLDEKKTKTLVQSPKAMHKIDSSETSTNRYEKSAIDHHVLALLTQLSFHLEKKSNSAIAGRACFSVLMDYMYYIHNPNPKAEKFLLNLVKNRYSFEKLIMSGFVAEMEKRISVVHDPKVCVRCMQINNTYQKLLSAVRQEAESDYGVGTLCHILSTGEKPSQLYAIHAVSKLIVLRSALFRLIIQGNGLSILLKFLTDESETTSTNAILYMCQLYQNLKKTSYGESVDKCCFSGTCSTKVVSKCAYKDASSDVTFCVGGISVSACRETICSNSEYFNALLKGYFLESNKDSIKIDGISAETLTTIFHFLHGCKTESSCPYIKRIPFAIQLELLSECEKFLLFDVKAYIVDRLCHNLFPKTVPKIYEAAKIFNSPELQKKALHFVLSMNIGQKDALLNCFRELMSLEKDFNFFNDVKILIQSTFQNVVVNMQMENN